MGNVLKHIYQGWKKLAFRLASIQNMVILSIVYILVIGPIWLLLKLIRKDLINSKPLKDKSFWIERKMEKTEIEDFYRQF